MKNLRILIDTNIILDWLLHREPFHNNAEYIIHDFTTFINDTLAVELAVLRHS